MYVYYIYNHIYILLYIHYYIYMIICLYIAILVGLKMPTILDLESADPPRIQIRHGGFHLQMGFPMGFPMGL